MRYILILTALLLLLGAVSCDRFEHSFAPPTDVDFDADFFMPGCPGRPASDVVREAGT